VLVVTPLGQAPLSPQIIVCTASGGSGKVCSGSLSAPAGVDSVGITLEDQPQAGATRGNALSQGTVVAVVSAGQTNDIRATLDGIVHAVQLVVAAPQVAYITTAGQHVSVVPTYVSVNALDADGNVITYNGAYIDKNGNSFAVSIGTSQLCGGSASCSVTLGATTISGPGAVVPVQASLDDRVASASESLTFTPTVAFGDPTVTLTPGTTSFVRAVSPTSVYGDGSAGVLVVASGSHVDLTQSVGSWQYSSVTVNSQGLLILPSGVTLRVSGAFVNNGNVLVSAQPNDASALGTLGIGILPANGYNGGIGIGAAATASQIRNASFGGGSGVGTPGVNPGPGGGGGGALVVLVGGTMSGSGTISADGAQGSASYSGSPTAELASGAGGGGGGLIILAAKGGVQNYSNGSLSAHGGFGGNSLLGTGTHPCGGGGGGGGFVELIAPDASTTLSSMQAGPGISVQGGVGGLSDNFGGFSPDTGYGGGASYGNGGSACTDGGNTTGSVGSAGNAIAIDTSTPEDLFL